MKNFEFHRPQKLAEALDLFGQHKGRARIWAGGTDLLVRLRDRALQIEALIDLKQIPHLDIIEYDKNAGLRLGTLARIRDIETSRIIRENFLILSEAAETLGSIQVRNKATVGGNICNASPSADMAPPLIALGAEVKIVDKGKEKTMPLETFFKGPGETALKNGEVLTEVNIPNMAPRSYGVYLKQGRRKALDLAVAGVASVLTLDPTLSKCVDIRIALGAVAPTPMRAKRTEAVIRGSDLSDSVLNEAAKIAAGECAPISDVRASEWYRREVVGALVKRSIQQAFKKLTACA
jgi:carbon-monoxide dehydrogenase medium subunit